MASDDDLVRSSDYCFAARDAVYLVYHHLPVSGATLDLRHTSGTYSVTWFDTMTTDTFTPSGAAATVTAGLVVAYGAPPTRGGQRWVAIFTKLPSVPTPSRAPSAPTPAPSNAPTSASACAGVTLNPGDAFCDDYCAGGSCVCAVLARSIPAGDSCNDVCAAAGLTCIRRHSDAGSRNRCAYYEAGTRVENCGGTGDNDDVCVCST